MRRPIIITALLGLAAVFSFAAQAQQTMRSVWDGVFTADQANRGKAEYDARCGACHGSELGGSEMAPPLSGSQFLGDWGGLSVDDLSERIRTTMPANDPGDLDRKTLTDIVAFVLSSNKFPAGSVELPATEETLRQIRVDLAKPAAK